MNILEFLRARLTEYNVRTDRHLLAVIEHTLEYEAGLDGEFACCHTPDEIAAGDCSVTPIDKLPILRHLASIYHTHPDFNQDWKEQA